MGAPSSVGAIEPVGMTNASTTKARKMNARMKATRIDSTVSFAPPSSSALVPRFDGGGAGALPGAASAAVAAALEVTDDEGPAGRSAGPRAREGARGGLGRCPRTTPRAPGPGAGAPGFPQAAADRP